MPYIRVLSHAGVKLSSGPARSVPAFFAGPSCIHGQGLFAVRPLVQGEKIVEYTGERVAKTASARRQVEGFAFLMELDETFDLDGSHPDNPARFLNHSCAPNCEAVKEHQEVWLRALRPIQAGEELTFDYGFRLAAFPGHPCRCGAAGCVGFIVGQTERWRTRRLLGRVGRSLCHGKGRGV